MSELNETRNESVNDGVFEAIAEANHETYSRNGTPDRSQNDPAATGETGGGTPTKPKQTKSDDVEGDNAEGLDTQDFSRKPVPSTTETEEQKPDEPSKTETKAETDVDWQAGLPSDPGEFKVQAPVPDENGVVSPEAYGDYLLQKFEHNSKVSEYNSKVITATFDAVDKILPEVRDNSVYQTIIRNTYASSLSPEQTVQMARELRGEIDRIAGENKTAGIRSAKTSITVQKNAAVEAKGAAQKTKSTDTVKSDNLSKRLARNDTSAFEELMDGWLEEGKI